MGGVAWLRRLRWLVTRRTRSGCCYYHGIDWHAVNKAAIRIAQQAEADGTQPDDLYGTIDSESCGLAEEELEAVRYLFTLDGCIGIDDDDPRDRSLQGGNHRVTAMRDARVRRTVILRPELIETTTHPS
jgi:hypothetical protein